MFPRRNETVALFVSPDKFDYKKRAGPDRESVTLTPDPAPLPLPLPRSLQL